MKVGTYVKSVVIPNETYKKKSKKLMHWLRIKEIMSFTWIIAIAPKQLAASLALLGRLHFLEKSHKIKVAVPVNSP